MPSLRDSVCLQESITDAISTSSRSIAKVCKGTGRVAHEGEGANVPIAAGTDARACVSIQAVNGRRFAI